MADLVERRNYVSLQSHCVTGDVTPATSLWDRASSVGRLCDLTPNKVLRHAFSLAAGGVKVGRGGETVRWRIAETR